MLQVSHRKDVLVPLTRVFDRCKYTRQVVDFSYRYFCVFKEKQKDQTTIY